MKNNSLIFLLLLQSLFITAQQVSDTETRQIGSTIEISYTLETKVPCAISLYVSKDEAATWEGPLTKVSGDVGTKIASGRNAIVWNVLEEVEQLIGDKIQFQVRAGYDLKIGDVYQGGIIVFILRPSRWSINRWLPADEGYDPDVPHGLIAAPSDQGNMKWTKANKICDDLELNGYTDWYLPSKEELNKICKFNAWAEGNFYQSLFDHSYWSSTQSVGGDAYFVGERSCRFSLPPYNYDIKCNVRAFRAF